METMQLETMQLETMQPETMQLETPVIETGVRGTAEDDTGQKHAPAATFCTGVVKWFNPGKGYGFIAPDAGGADIFVHISAVQHAGLRKLLEGEKVRFALEQREGRVAAVGIERSH
jgi:CspA family cold shock protein